jgi:hypothetical protein
MWASSGVADASVPTPERAWYLFPAPETLYCALSPEKQLLSQPPQQRECHSSGTFRRGEVLDYKFEKPQYLGAPLRNRTVDLLLTMHTSAGSLPGGGSPGSSIRLAGYCCDLPRGTEGCGYETRALPG